MSDRDSKCRAKMADHVKQAEHDLGRKLTLQEMKQIALRSRPYRFEAISFWHNGNLYRVDPDGSLIHNVGYSTS